MLLPQGLVSSPYEILDYDVTLILHDRRGARATFRRRQEVRFLQDGVGGMLDHAWGHGVLVTNYQTDAGSLEDTIRDEDRRHLVLGFKRRMARGERLAFQVERTAMVGFTEGHEWTGTTLDHPSQRLASRIVFPKSRPCWQATLMFEGTKIVLPAKRLASGRTLVQFAISRPRAYTPYTVRWHW
jgi:hypothetical protein